MKLTRLVQQGLVKNTPRITDAQFELLYSLMPEQKTLRFADDSKSEVFHQTNKEHVAQMLFQAMQFAKGFQLDKILDMRYVNALIMAHDLPELGMDRDVTMYQCLTNPDLRITKEEYEIKKIAELKNKYGSWISNLCNDYIERGSDEAKFVKWLDKFNASQHLIEKTKIVSYEEQQNWEEDDWLQRCGNTMNKVSTAAFLRPMTLKVLKEREPVYIKNGFGELYNHEKGRLEREINSTIITK